MSQLKYKPTRHLASRHAACLARRHKAMLYTGVYFFVPLDDHMDIASGSVFSWPKPGFPDIRNIVMFQSSPTTEDARAIGIGPSVVSIRIHQVEAPLSALAAKMDAAFGAVRRAFEGILPSVIVSARDGELKTKLESELRTDVTVLEVMTLLPGTRPDLGALSDSFDLCLEHCRRLQRGYLIGSGLRMKPITWESLPPTLPYVLQRRRRGREGFHELEIGHYHLNWNFGVKRTTFPATQELAERIAHALHVADVGHPILQAGLQLRLADYARNVTGQYDQVLIASAIFAEVYLDTLLMLMLWEEGILPLVAAGKEFDRDRGLAYRVRSHYAPRLGGVWDFNKHGPVQQWNDDLVRVRHRLVHAGYEPTARDADRAHEAIGSLIEYVRARLLTRLDTYPRTAWLMFGRDQLNENGKLPKKLVQFLSRHASSESDWMAGSASWIGRINLLRGY